MNAEIEAATSETDSLSVSLGFDLKSRRKLKGPEGPMRAARPAVKEAYAACQSMAHLLHGLDLLLRQPK
jgi:hypothetical protein